MASLVCNLCGKSCIQLTSVAVKDGNLCSKCGFKLDAIIEVKYDAKDFSISEIVELLNHPAKALKIHPKQKDPSLACCVCGRDRYSSTLKFRTIADGSRLCGDCQEKSATIDTAAVADPESFFSSHDSAFFKEELEECYFPKSTILFNFKTEKIYIMDSLFRKGYRLIDFSDILSYNCEKRGRTRFLDMDFRFNGSTMRFHTDNSMDKHYEMAKIVDCLKMIPRSIPSNM